MSDKGRTLPSWSLWVMGSLLGIVLTLVGAIFGEETLSATLQSHVELPGHPIVVERVTVIQEDMKEIKMDIKELLRRVPNDPK